MRFRLTLQSDSVSTIIPVNYQYPLSAAVYKILDTADKDYASFLHTTGYGKGFKLFTFSQINCPFKINGDRLTLLSDKLYFEIAFHLPAAAENFIKGLFQTQKLTIADKFSKGIFTIVSVESIPVHLPGKTANELITTTLTPLSPIVTGIPDEKGKDEYLAPGDPRFTASAIYNWREKIKACYDENTATSAILLAEILPMKRPAKSRLISIKANTTKQTKIRGWMNFNLKVTGEKRFTELLLNAGVGIYNAMGMGFVEVERGVRNGG